MTFGEILYSIFIMPLQLFFEMVFSTFNEGLSNPGLTIIALSMAMNMLVLPLYRRADALQEEEREIEAKLRKGVEHIKKTFKGDEKMMMLQTYYRQNHYSPLSVFKNSLSLFLEIPFFIAAYNFLSQLDLLNGVRFGIIPNLGAPDGLLVIGGCSINILPFVMTAVNLVSCVIFTKGFPLKTKVQLYGMALFFMVFLYNSPAGLVFYWTLNNIFNLVKTILYKVENPRKIIFWIFMVFGFICISYGCYRYYCIHGNQPAILWGVICLIINGIYYRDHQKNIAMQALGTDSNVGGFWGSAIFLAVLAGLVIPSAVIQSSPQEFFDINNPFNPLWFIVSCGCIAFGAFVFWLGVFYWIATRENRVRYEKWLWIISLSAVVNYLFFGRHLGVLLNTLQYEHGVGFSDWETGINAGIIILIGLVGIYTYKLVSKYVFQITSVAVLALLIMTGYNIYGINVSLAQVNKIVETKKVEDLPTYTLSKHGNNVVVIMLDRAINDFIPYIMAEKPELKEIYSGFVYYPNTVSFGGHTNFGTPALFGGYEYTPEEMNRRSEESLKKKHNEAIRVMPVLFDRNGYKVTVFDPPYAGYQWTPDLSIYDEYPNINKYNIGGKFTDVDTVDINAANKRNFFFYSLMKMAPEFAQRFCYNDGKYFMNSNDNITKQIIESIFIAHGNNKVFLNEYNVLKNLPRITKFKNSSNNTFLMMANDTPHAQTILQEPEYVPAVNVDNSMFADKYNRGLTCNGKSITLNTVERMQHYHINMAALLQVGKWLQYLKKNGVYDNTRIIIVADHGYALYLTDGVVLDDRQGEDYSLEAYHPLLLVKDFNCNGELKTSEEFMTNGDVPTLAFNGLINSPVNPFTGKEINNSKKYTHEQHILASDKFKIDVNNGNTFMAGDWFAVHDDMRDIKNWRKIDNPLGK